MFLSEKPADDSEDEAIILPAIAEEKPDIASITDTNQKKQTFFDYLRPGVAIENARIEKERRRLLSIKQALDEQSLTSEQQATAKRLGKLYSLEPSEVNYEWVNAMLER
ncbi:putative Bax protein [Vibrio maritimus]|uniref:Putative Bax protein n=1 Tax=Vibrio maritimus TaxID=990268 RepID=A0A090U0Q8_9VIBR|nr:putative Bax protein [Vibrio maritimus]